MICGAIHTYTYRSPEVAPHFTYKAKLEKASHTISPSFFGPFEVPELIDQDKPRYERVEEALDVQWQERRVSKKDKRNLNRR